MILISNQWIYENSSLELDRMNVARAFTGQESVTLAEILQAGLDGTLDPTSALAVVFSQMVIPVRVVGAVACDYAAKWIESLKSTGDSPEEIYRRNPQKMKYIKESMSAAQACADGKESNPFAAKNAAELFSYHAAETEMNAAQREEGGWKTSRWEDTRGFAAWKREQIRQVAVLLAALNHSAA